MKSHLKRVYNLDIPLKERVVDIRRVTKVTKGGRTFSFYALVVVGDEKNYVGYGEGKANEVNSAIQKAIEKAKKNLIYVPVYKGTIPHEQEAKFGAAKVVIMPAAPGTGVKAGNAMRAVLESVGLKDVMAKSKGSNNSINVVKATFEALAQLRDPKTIAETRGVPLSKVFNG